jgi:nucleoside 2-deoxyribosyltransferase
MYYLATPLYRTDVKFSAKDPARHERNEKLCKKIEDSGFDIFLPQRDVNQSLSGKEILEEELKVIKQCEGLIIVLSDTRGIYLEAGYAKALGKKVVALKVEETRDMSEWGNSFFDFVATNEMDLLNHLREIKQKSSIA